MFFHLLPLVARDGPAVAPYLPGFQSHGLRVIQRGQLQGLLYLRKRSCVAVVDCVVSRTRVGQKVKVGFKTNVIKAFKTNGK